MDVKKRISKNKGDQFKPIHEKIRSKYGKAKKPKKHSSCFILIVFIIVLSLFYLSYFFHCHKIPAWEKHSVIESLSTKLVGQDLAIQLVVESLTDYMKNLETDYHPPLVLSFHGDIGVGKTYLASLLYKYLPENTQFSRFYFFHHYNFNSAENNKNKILPWINMALSLCHWNIFILDDFDNIGSAKQILTDTLTHLKGSNLYKYNYVIFIIISNINSENINNVVFRNAQNGNQNRLKLADFNPEFNEDSPNGWFFKLYKQGLIDAVIPFFPLDKTNVLKCIKAELANHHQIINENLTMKILKEIYFDSTNVFNYEYSKTGCKKVSDKIYLWMNKTN